MCWLFVCVHIIANLWKLLSVIRLLVIASYGWDFLFFVNYQIISLEWSQKDFVFHSIRKCYNKLYKKKKKERIITCFRLRFGCSLTQRASQRVAFDFIYLFVCINIQTWIFQLMEWEEAFFFVLYIPQPLLYRNKVFCCC